MTRDPWHTTTEKWYCPEKEIAVTIEYHFENGYYTETIDYVAFGKTWGDKVNTLVKYHTKRDLCLPYEHNWSNYKKIGHDNTTLNGTWGREERSVYTEREEVVKERVYRDTDYVVMGEIGKRHWIEELWAKLTEVK